MSSKTTTTTKEEDKPALVPKLRFPEFQRAERWQPKRLGLALKFQPGFPFPSAGFNNSGKGLRLIRNRDLRSDDIVIFYSDEFDSNFVVKNGDVLVGMDGDFTPTVWEKGDALLNQRVGRILPRGDSDQKFLLYLLTLSLKRIEEATARTTVKHLSHSAVEDRDEPIPSPAEQQKIADCLSSADELIAAQARKVEALKIHKKWLMQQLFPREGETQPRHRFPKFLNFGGWVEEKLDSLVHFQDGFAFKSTDFVKRQEDTTQVIRITDINNQNTNEEKVYIPTAFLERNKLGKYRVDDGDLLLSLTGAAGFNFFFWNGGPATINQRTAKVTSKRRSEHALLQLLEPLIHEKINKRGEGQNNNLSKEFLSKIVLLIPGCDEQQDIATCLSSLNALITAETQKYEALKIHKEGLMHQLFPTLKEVGA
jgi:type I restriction enzyme S subunit